MTRLYVLEIKPEIILDDKEFHYLTNVLKKTIGDKILCFDGKNGEFEYEIIQINKKNLQLQEIKQTKKFHASPDIWLLFSPLKKDCTDFVLQKATELGVSKLIPVITQRTNSERFNLPRAQAQIIEACEQCERLDIPEIQDLQSLRKFLQTWPDNRKLFFMQERGANNTIAQVFSDNKDSKAAILIGPEGGFSSEEVELLNQLPYCISTSMGIRILRAETAASSALSCWQAICGDW